MKAFIRILTWLGIMAGLTLLAMGVWYLAFGGGQTTTSLKWLQFLQTLGTFLIPPILCAWMWDTDHRPFSWLKMDQRTHWSLFVIAVGIMICAIPAINLLSDLNSRIELPESLASIEQILKQQEEAAALLTERFLQADNFGQLLLNLGLLALLPALAEELSFRGTLQQILANSQEPCSYLGNSLHLFSHPHAVLRLHPAYADGRHVRVCVCLVRLIVATRPDAFYEQCPRRPCLSFYSQQPTANSQ